MYEAEKLKMYYDLTDADKVIVVQRAIRWNSEHKEHIDRLIKEASGSYSPCGSDLFRPELWKAAHWRWWRNIQ